MYIQLYLCLFPIVDLDWTMAEEVVQCHFKRAKAREKQLILEQIKAVIECNKPSFLFDMVATSAGKLQEFLHDLNQKINQDLILLSVDSVHHFIGMRQPMCQALKNTSNLFFIDVSSDLEYPTLIKDLEEKPEISSMCETCLQTLDSDLTCMDIELKANWPGCSLFGILLGFIVVYYHEPNQENCLSMIELKRFNLQTQSNVSISSFSVPYSLLQSNPSMIRAIEEWKNQKTDYRISEEVVMLPNVIM